MHKQYYILITKQLTKHNNNNKGKMAGTPQQRQPITVGSKSLSKDFIGKFLYTCKPETCKASNEFLCMVNLGAEHNFIEAIESFQDFISAFTLF